MFKWCLYCFFILFPLCVWAERDSSFVYVRGRLFLDVPSRQMDMPLDFSGESAPEVIWEKQVPAGAATISYRVILPEYVEGLFFSRDYRRGDHGWPNNTNRLLPWPFHRLADLTAADYPGIPSNGKVLLQGDALLLHLKDGRYVFLKAVAGDNAMSWLKVTKEGQLNIYVSTLGEDYLSNEVPVALYASDRSVYRTFEKAYRQLIASPKVADLRKRTEKVFPEPFKYLGWCTWEHYRRNINEKQLLEDFRRIEDSGIPVRYVLIDDGHVRHKKDQLCSFRPDSVKFPRGWQPILSARKEDKIRWMGVWYGFPGFWQGISAENDFPANIKSKLYAFNGSMVPGTTEEDIRAYYRYYVESLQSYGFDFLKIDVQSFVLPLYMGSREVIRQARACNTALEAETHRLGVGLINCMAQNILNTDHTRYSNVTRVSIDYQKFNEDMARSHLFQSYTNTLWQGQTVWPDHDMFHSCDSICGGMMARSKAVSGGPVYLSDAPRDFVKELILPLVDREGRLFRPEAPAVPTPESVFTDPFTSGRAYRVVAPVGQKAMAMICYNLNKDPRHKQVKVKLTPEDYAWREAMTGRKTATPPAAMILYDWERREAAPLTGAKEIVLDGFTDRLFHFCPVDKGWAVIGLQEKYLSPATVEIIACTPHKLVVEVKEKGTLKVWQDDQVRDVIVDKPGKITLQK